ncbi:hypothetical protein AVEN_173190-1 [Araneus ventricosus]|uniref:Uncharacterized protein n=1 Tax=Araneus ventricosus TaxID=182803 RepID=A0A4Y2X6U5_ARAVE|nr:hypothetical protein AVEN_173190-1 [Araneus ventricosus]
MFWIVIATVQQRKQQTIRCCSASCYSDACWDGNLITLSPAEPCCQQISTKEAMCHNVRPDGDDVVVKFDIVLLMGFQTFTGSSYTLSSRRHFIMWYKQWRLVNLETSSASKVA